MNLLGGLLFGGGFISVLLVLTCHTSIPMIRKLEELQGQPHSFPRFTEFFRTHRVPLFVGGLLFSAIGLGLMVAFGEG
jgi:hypothetical protein